MQVVLGAYYGTGTRGGGKVSVFLCGVLDETVGKWKTVKLVTPPLSLVFLLLPAVVAGFACVVTVVMQL